MRELFQLLKKTMEQKKDSVLVTVIGSSGSTPRGTGARMLITKEGRVTGTIGGGAVEYQSELLAEKVLEKKSVHLEKFILAPNDVADLGMICGGKVSVLFQYISWENSVISKICAEVESHMTQNLPCWLVSKINESGNSASSIGFFSKEVGVIGLEDSEFDTKLLKNDSSIIEIEGEKYFVESLVSAGKVYIFGGGHVSQALVPVLKNLDFYCVVVDDRSHFLTKELFPKADERLEVDLGNIGASIELTEHDYGIVMTRGHQFDFQLEVQLLKTKMKYIGVMGSKHKIATHVKKLQEVGFSLDEIKQVHMPIGMAIQAETPSELAISVAGELIAVRAQGKKQKRIE